MTPAAIGQPRGPRGAGRSVAVWVLGGACVALVAASVAVMPARGWSVTQDQARDFLVACAFGPVGAKVAGRRPDKTVGWLLLAIALSASLALFASVHAGPLALAWTSQWVWWPTFGLLPVALLAFHPAPAQGRRWGLALRIAVLAAVGATVLLAVAALWRPRDLLEGVPVSGSARIVLLLAVAFIGLTLLSLAAAVVALVRRCRQASGNEREQLRWLAAAAALAIVSAYLEVAAVPGAWVVGAAAVPLAVGVTIQRYHLYELDRLVNRVAVYAIVSVTLAGIYAGGVLAAGVYASLYTGERLGVQDLLAAELGSSSLLVAGLTLLATVLFGPLRRRVQTWIDRHFSRARYDAAVTVDAFGRRLRDCVALDELTADLLTTTHATMQPQTAILWLRPAGPAEQSDAGTPEQGTPLTPQQQRLR